MITSYRTAIRSAGTEIRNYELQDSLALVLELYSIELVELLRRAFRALGFDFDTKEYAGILDSLKPDIHKLMYLAGNGVTYADEDTGENIARGVGRSVDGKAPELTVVRTESAARCFMRYIAHRLSGRHTQEEALKVQVSLIWQVAYNRGDWPSELLNPVLSEWHSLSYYTFHLHGQQTGLPAVLDSILQEMSGLPHYMGIDPPEDFTDIVNHACPAYIQQLQR
ncbi:MAG: hypothetical protein K0S68_167 [Candidatus Saccharibacteria bacterium]|jgi:hypothetical protein|nr:hypothetical protein [Candidatus Saccharibacteria bacterium]